MMPSTVPMGTDHTQGQICTLHRRDAWKRCTKYTAHTGNRHSDIHREQMSRPLTGNKCLDHSQGTEIQTINRERMSRPHTGNRYTDHTQGTDV